MNTHDIETVLRSFLTGDGYIAADDIPAICAALEAERGDGWQPIETAPKGAWFLVHSDRGWIGLARRSDPDYAPDEGWFEDEHTEFLDPAWLTHWRPLPAPPAIDRARGKGGKEAIND